MSLRETMNNNPAAATGSVVGLLVIALGVIWFTQCRGGAAGGASKITYYDTSTGKIILVDASRGSHGSPLPDNASAFQCSIFSCTECGDIAEGMTLEELEAKGMYIGFLSRDPQLDESGLGDMGPDFNRAQELKAVDHDDWLTIADTNAYNKLVTEAMDCDGVRATRCGP